MRVETERANLVFIAFLAVRCLDVGVLFWMPLRLLTFRMICCVLAGFLVAAVVKETPRGKRLLKKAQAIVDMKQAKALGLILVVAQCVAVAVAVVVVVVVVVVVAAAAAAAASAMSHIMRRHLSVLVWEAVAARLPDMPRVRVVCGLCLAGPARRGNQNNRAVQRPQILGRFCSSFACIWFYSCLIMCPCMFSCWARGCPLRSGRSRGERRRHQKVSVAHRRLSGEVRFSIAVCLRCFRTAVLAFFGA